MNDGVHAKLKKALCEIWSTGVDDQALGGLQAKPLSALACSDSVASASHHPNAFDLRESLADPFTKKSVAPDDENRMPIF
ncbi:hypothetical protein AWB82_00790 [Caballeronia glebae]|uniref:Uncharacterized protein n=1 Tax=Caballeronia glebae TaxID=1777143 RepID=A0A157ZM05_9BURK|nr:hypothetical protein [Caballeronia glebae]SAK45997.1 hypothetical protein AWB82_00790 [Caballeronia glebae]